MSKMVLKFSVVAVILLFCLADIGEAQGTFDITKYGAKADGKTEMTQALLDAWKAACESTTQSTILIPAGEFLLGEILLKGECKAPIVIQVDGTFKAPANPDSYKTGTWVTINYIDHLTIQGKGAFDGQGPTAWAQNDCAKNQKCKKLAMNLSFNFVTNSIIRDITSKDSKNFNVNVIGCKNFTFQNFNIIAPANSPNTDGIHLGRSVGVNILDSTLMTGDDCISIGDGAEQIHVERVTCGPGHGFSVGSLGRTPNESPVIGLTIKNCTLTGTDNGVRIKTWPSSPNPSVVKDLHFEDIIMNDVSNPILIDQEYCPYAQCKLDSPSLVKISNVTYTNIRGTSKTQVAVKIACSKGVPCENVVIGDIDLTYKGPEGPATSVCSNVKPTFTGKQNPAVCSGKPVSAS